MVAEGHMNKVVLFFACPLGVLPITFGYEDIRYEEEMSQPLKNISQ
jgi:hypothetical protein